MPNEKLIPGQRFNHLVAVGPKKNDRKNALWWFLCDCGSRFTARADSVLSGRKPCCRPNCPSRFSATPTSLKPAA